MSLPIDSVLFLGFGGPEAPDEIMPFLRQVVEGRGIADERLRSVEKHYLEVGGRSPYNEKTEQQRAGVERWLAERGRTLPVYAGMRNWQPFLVDVIKKMNEHGRRHAAGVILASHRTPSGWDRYKTELEKAIAECGEGPEVTFLPPWFDEMRFLEANATRLEEASGYECGEWPAEVPVIFTAHSVPTQEADGAPYVEEIKASCQGIADILELPDWELAYQSRSGRPGTPWLEPDINDVLKRRAEAGCKEVAVQAVGFLCDHVEVLYDLDVEAARTASELKMKMHRAACVNDHPEFIALLGEKILEVAARGES